MDNNEENNGAPVEEAAEAAAPEEAAPAAEEAAAPAAPEAPAAAPASSGTDGNPIQDFMARIGGGDLEPKAQYLLLGGALLGVISMFFPWVEATASASGGGVSHSATATLSGFGVWPGLVGLVCTIAAVKMILQKHAWDWAPLAVNVLLFFFMLVATPGGEYSASGGGASAEASTSAGFGVFVFLAGTVLIGVMSINKEKIDAIQRQLKIKK